MCRIDDAEPCEWFGTKMRKAKKQHQCNECNRAILCGEIYAYSSYVLDGSMCTNKACGHCHASRDWLNKHCGGWLTEGLSEELHEHFQEGYKEDLLPRLIVGVRRKWQRFDGRGLMPMPAIAA